MKIEIIEQGKSGSLFKFAAGPFSASLWMNVPMVSLFADGKLIRACTMDEIEQIALYLLSMVETGRERDVKRHMIEFNFIGGALSAIYWAGEPTVSLFVNSKLILVCTLDETEQIAFHLLSLVETGLKREAKLPVSEVLEGGAR